MADEQPDPRRAAVAAAVQKHLFGDDYPTDESQCCVEPVLAAADAVDPSRAALRSIAEIAGASESATARLADIRQVLLDAGVTT